MGDLLSSGVQVARHDATEYALPTDRGLTRGDGQLVDFLRCVAVRVGRALLYQQFCRSPRECPFETRDEETLFWLT